MEKSVSSYDKIKANEIMLITKEPENHEINANYTPQ